MKTTTWKLLLPLLALLLPFAPARLLAQEAVLPENALGSYLETPDGSYAWEVREVTDAGPAKAYDLMLVSQTWKGHVWKHQPTVIVPKVLERGTALLFIDGGIVDGQGEPRWRPAGKNSLALAMGKIAVENRAVTAVVKQVPMQPLYGGKTEDELISMTLHRFRQDGDPTWPLLFPMVKSAVRAMDAVQEFSRRELETEVSDFVLAGASKRGWTTWLAAASGDRRVRAIAPIVIDVLNMPANLRYQIEAYDEYSAEISDYTELGLVQAMETDSVADLVRMIDPYAYRAKLAMPKLIINGTNDPYWVVDGVKHYLDSIPGTNLLHYAANGGHNLGPGRQDAFRALGAFFGYTAQGKPYPETGWTATVRDGEIRLDIRATAEKLIGARRWTAISASRDFRNAEWKSEGMSVSNVSAFSAALRLPSEGYAAFYVDLVYRDLNGKPYSQSTRPFVVDGKGLL